MAIATSKTAICYNINVLVGVEKNLDKYYPYRDKNRCVTLLSNEFIDYIHK